MGQRVLVIEDDPEIRRLVAAVLGTSGYSVDLAEGGREGIAKIEWHSYDAIILDLMMPGISGFQVLEAIKKARPNSKCVIVISAAASREIEKVDPTIVRAKLRKPFDIHELIAAVKLCTDGTP